MENSRYSYGDAIEYFARNVLHKNEDLTQRLKQLKIESRQLQAQMKANQTEMELISEELKVNPNDDLLFADEIKKSIRSVIRWFNREKQTYKTIENFFELKGKRIKPYADECGLNIEEFKKRVISEHYSREESKSNK